MDIAVEYVKLSSTKFVKKLAWHRANECHIQKYKDELALRLSARPIPREALWCSDLHCNKIEHRIELNNLCADIGLCCLAAGNDSIPSGHDTHAAARCGCIPGWSDYVQPLKETSLFWHNLWVQAGRPQNGTVACIMRSTRACYHRAIKQVRLQEADIRKEKFATLILSNRSRDFWTEIRKIRNTRGSTPCIIDGITSEQDISALFANKCEDLYNSVSFNVCDIKLMEDNLADKISSSPSPDVFVKPREVWDAMHKLKRGKNDGCDSLSSEHFIFAGFELSVHISMLLTALFSHGYVPDELCLSTVIPIPKDKRGDMSDSSNYRGIALSSIICKIIDLIILSRYNDLLMSSELQFGFKPKRSTGMCTMLLKEVVSYYTSHASSVYCTFLDASKAFDRVNYTKLFTSLFDRQLPPTIIRFLLHMYTGHKTRVSWNKVYSDLFAISNGVRQGGILSPILFCVYINDLLVRLQKSNKGCFVGSMFVGVLAYADDIVILAPTPSSMRSLLKICDSFASEFDVKFNSIKSKCLLFLICGLVGMSLYLIFS
jgi:hypothetical protein